MSTFLERLVQAAEFAGVGATQAAIADTLGIKRQTVNRWFRDGIEPNSDNCFDIAAKFGVDGRWLKQGEGEMLPKPSPDGLTLEERDLIRNYRTATPQVRSVLRTMVRAARKSVVTIGAVLPPLLALPQAESALNYVACVLCQILGRRRYSIVAP